MANFRDSPVICFQPPNVESPALELANRLLESFDREMMGEDVVGRDLDQGLVAQQERNKRSRAFFSLRCRSRIASRKDGGLSPASR